MSFSRSARSVAWGALLGLSLGGCSTGGQSGSEGPDSEGCPDPIALEPDEKPPTDRGGVADSPNEFLAKFAGPTSMNGVWLHTDERPALIVEISRTPIATTFSPCEYLVDTTATIRTSDGALDLTTPVRISAPHSREARFSIALTELPPEVVGDPLWPPDEAWARMLLGDLVPLDAPSPSLGVDLKSDILHPSSKAVVINDHMAVGAWADEGLPITGPPTLYTPPPELASSCLGAEEFQTPFSQPGFEYTPFSSGEAALAAVVGSWVRCTDSAASERAGLQIVADGSWRDLAFEGGALVARTGFDHEGAVSAVATQGNLPGLFLLYFSDSSGGWGAPPASNRALVFPSATFYWPPAVYLPTTLPVR